MKDTEFRNKVSKLVFDLIGMGMREPKIPGKHLQLRFPFSVNGHRRRKWVRGSLGKHSLRSLGYAAVVQLPQHVDQQNVENVPYSASGCRASACMQFLCDLFCQV